MVDEQDKLRFEKQLDEISAQTELVVTCCPGGVTGGLSRAITSLVGLLVSFTSLVGLLVSFTARCGGTKTYVSVLLHEPDSFMGQQQQRRQQSREAKAAENHAVAVALLLVPVLLLLLLLSLLPLLLLLLWLLLRRFLCCPCSTKIAPVLDDDDAESTGVHNKRVLEKRVLEKRVLEKRVLALLLEGGDIGLGEDNQVSLAATLRYVVLRVAQSAAYCFTSAMSLFARCLCTSDGNGELPEGATKYVVVEFNAWVYSGVSHLLCIELGT